MAVLFAFAVTIVILGWLWFFIARPILEDFGVLSRLSFDNNDSYVEREVANGQTDQTDEQTDLASEALGLINQFRLDRSRSNLIDIMVYSDCSTSEVRALLKGDNAAIGLEVDAAKKRLGIEEGGRTIKVRDIHGEREIAISD